MLPHRVRAFTSFQASSSRHVNIYIAARSITTHHGRRDPNVWQRPRQIIIETPQPAQTTKKAVLKLLKSNFCMTTRAWSEFLKVPGTKARYDEAVVILATPSFAEWLEDDVTFIPFLVRSLIRKVIPRPEKDGGALEIDVVCACVDGLPPSLDRMKIQRGQPLIEGFALLHGRADHILPGLWEATPDAAEHSPTLQSSLTFSTYQKPSTLESGQTPVESEQKPVTEVTLPLANTLFVNGKHSTVRVSRWSAPSKQFMKVRTTRKSNQLINVFGEPHLDTLPSHIPAIPITPARRIVNGLGNIVRQLSFAEDDVGPASRELETNIHEYLRAIGRPDTTISVWALVTPSESLPDSTRGQLFDSRTDIESAKVLWQSDNLNPTFIGQWLQRGATLCRVLSGGGGWGAKQGLLSLDPQTTYSADNEARFDYSDQSLEEQQALALGSLAKPNSFVQFFVVPEDSKSPWVHESRIKHGEDWHYQSTAFGTVPSTIDKVPAATPKIGLMVSKLLSYKPGRFGAVSESGIYINSAAVKNGPSKKQTLVRTKIDLPYSYLYRDLVPESVKSDEPKLPKGSGKQQTGKPGSFKLIKHVSGNPYLYRDLVLESVKSDKPKLPKGGGKQETGKPSSFQLIKFVSGNPLRNKEKSPGSEKAGRDQLVRFL